MLLFLLGWLESYVTQATGTAEQGVHLLCRRYKHTLLLRFNMFPKWLVWMCLLHFTFQRFKMDLIRVFLLSELTEMFLQSSGLIVSSFNDTFCSWNTADEQISNEKQQTQKTTHDRHGDGPLTASRRSSVIHPCSSFLPLPSLWSMRCLRWSISVAHNIFKSPFYNAHVMPGQQLVGVQMGGGRTKVGSVTTQRSGGLRSIWDSYVTRCSRPDTTELTVVGLGFWNPAPFAFSHQLYLRVALFRPLSSTDSALPPLCSLRPNRGWRQINNRPHFFWPFCAFAVLCSGGIVRARESNGKWWNVP